MEHNNLKHSVPFSEAFWVWLKIGLISFGGPAGQIALMHQILVEEKRWISEERFLQALNYCMLLPGPEAQQLAIYMGWLLHRTSGGLVAGILFILPGFIIIMGLSILYALYQKMAIVEGLFLGIKAAILVIVLEAVMKIGKRALKNIIMIWVAVFAFIAIFFFKIPFPIIIISAAFLGLLGGYFYPQQFIPINIHKLSHSSAIDELIANGSLEHIHPNTGRALKILFICLALWFTPIFLTGVIVGKDHIFIQESLFFSKMAVVTFGGAYAVLSYVAQAAVETYHWLLPGEMLDGLGLAETTPGPLIMVVQFVGFLGAFRNPGTLDPVLAGILGASLTIWVTFTPCFLWIFLGAPYVEKLKENQHLNAILSTITAAVVGVILNLAIWFSLHVLFSDVQELKFWHLHVLLPSWYSLNEVVLVTTIVAGFLIFRVKCGIVATLVGCALLGVGYQLLMV